MVRLGAVGDVVRTLAAASALRQAYPRSHIAWLVEPAAASVVQGQPWLDQVMVFPRAELRAAVGELRLRHVWGLLRSVLRQMRTPRFDLVMDFHSILKSGLLCLASGASMRVTYARPTGREAAWLFATHRARLHPARTSRFERNRALVAFLGLEPRPLARPLDLDPDLRRRIGEPLRAAPAPIAIHPGTSNATAHKRYSSQAYAAVARALAQEPGLGSIVTFGPARDDRNLAEAVVAASAGAARLAPPTASLTELAALFSHCRLYVGGDTGPMHLASLVGTPVVQILGPTDPVENAPYAGTPSRTVRVPVACSPCRRGCSAATCMRVVPPQAVIEAARELLAAGERGW